MKSIKRTQRIISLLVLLFIAGMGLLIFKLVHESTFYMMNSDVHEYGYVYDRSGDVLFDGTGNGTYPDNHFLDVGNIIGDDKGQMNNTLVAQNLEKINSTASKDRGRLNKKKLFEKSNTHIFMRV